MSESDFRPDFRVEEATIDDVHRAIRAGRATCVAFVRPYLARARAHNGVASRLVTENGAAVADAAGTVRAGAALAFPAETVPAATIYPDLDRYRGKPLEFGRMEPTRLDPAVQQQYGMIAGIPNGTQLNALGTLEYPRRALATCKGAYDRHLSEGPLPPGALAGSATSSAASSTRSNAPNPDAQYGTNCCSTRCRCTASVFLVWKDPFDTKDMRTTAGGDAAYDIDFPARRPSPVEDQLRKKGAIVYAKAVEHRV